LDSAHCLEARLPLPHRQPVADILKAARSCRKSSGIANLGINTNQHRAHHSHGHHEGGAMENDMDAKRLALDLITRCRGEGRTIETIANAAGWILQIIAHLEAQRGNGTAAAPDLRDHR
jgi:hypothetical protein